MIRFWRYLNHSNLKVSIDLNPFVWGFKAVRQKRGDDKQNPHWAFVYFRFAFLSFIVVGDDGTVVIDTEVEIMPSTTKADAL